MKILQIIDYFQPKLGYQETYLSKKLMKLGHEVRVITSDRYFPFPNYDYTVKNILGKRKLKPGYFIEEGIKVQRLPVLFEIGHWIYLKGLKKAIHTFKPDAIHIHNHYSFTAFRVARLKNKNCKLIVDSHLAQHNFSIANPLKRIVLILFKKIFLPTIIRNADYIVGVSEGAKTVLQKFFGIKKEIIVIPLCAETDIFKKNIKDRYKKRKEFGLKEEDILFIHVGKLTPDKDVDIIINSIKQYMRNDKKIKLFIIGQGDKEYINFLKSKIEKEKNQIKFFNFMTNYKLAEFYNMADIGIWAGAHSITIEEAMATGLPIIVPKLNSTEHLVGKNNGFLFNKGNIEELKQIIQKIINNKNILSKMGKNSLKLINEELNYNKITQDFLKCYKN